MWKQTVHRLYINWSKTHSCSDHQTLCLFSLQAGNYSFNRAKLMNVGFWEAMLEETWDCVFFHDVDLIPEDDRNIYICDDNPKHASIAVNKFNYMYMFKKKLLPVNAVLFCFCFFYSLLIWFFFYRLPYSTCFGGVSALTPSQFYRINGFPNNYWGWGGEDDDVATRWECCLLYRHLLLHCFLLYHDVLHHLLHLGLCNFSVIFFIGFFIFLFSYFFFLDTPCWAFGDIHQGVTWHLIDDIK